MPPGTRHHRTRHLIRETFRLFPPLLLVLLLSLPALARRQDDDDVVRVESDLVILNVTVTDAQGRFIRKLRRTDFQVFEDGREQTINSFLVEETPFAAAILLDTSSSMERRISLARAAAIRFLDGLRGDDVTALYNFNDEVETSRRRARRASTTRSCWPRKTSRPGPKRGAPSSSSPTGSTSEVAPLPTRRSTPRSTPAPRSTPST
jgi:hypothetical protein